MILFQREHCYFPLLPFQKKFIPYKGGFECTGRRGIRMNPQVSFRQISTYLESDDVQKFLKKKFSQYLVLVKVLGRAVYKSTEVISIKKEKNLRLKNQFSSKRFHSGFEINKCLSRLSLQSQVHLSLSSSFSCSKISPQFIVFFGQMPIIPHYLSRVSCLFINCPRTVNKTQGSCKFRWNSPQEIWLCLPSTSSLK